MSTNQELRQKTCRDSAGTSYNVNGDWLAIASDAGFSTGTFNERLLNYYNAPLGATWGVAAWDEVAWGGAAGEVTYAVASLRGLGYTGQSLRHLTLCQR